MKKNNPQEQGQSLVEVIVALAIAVVIIIAFTNVTINAVRDAQFAKNENQATRLAQKTIELIRAIRDQGNDVRDTDYNASDLTTLSNETTFATLWGINLGTSGQCFRLHDELRMTQVASGTCAALPATSNDQEITIDNTIFTRRINISNDANTDKKTIVVTVSWTDGRGTHNTEARTILTRWQ